MYVHLLIHHERIIDIGHPPAGRIADKSNFLVAVHRAKYHRRNLTEVQRLLIETFHAAHRNGVVFWIDGNLRFSKYGGDREDVGFKSSADLVRSSDAGCILRRGREHWLIHGGRRKIALHELLE